MKTPKKREAPQAPIVISDPGQIPASTAQWVRNPKALRILKTLGVIVVLCVGGYIAFQYYKDTMEVESQAEMFSAVYYFEKDSLNLALRGDGIHYGFLDIIENYPFTKAANLSKLYAGICYLQEGDYESSKDYLDDFSSSDLILKSRALALLGDIHVELGQPERSVKYYQQAASHNQDKYFAPLYLKKLALALEEIGDLGGAAAAYDRIIGNCDDERLERFAIKHRERLAGMMVQ